tara:strand:+ start:84382 stop:84675 length:294 start_codon:yes stop_codon:yes gene_type:complete
MEKNKDGTDKTYKDFHIGQIVYCDNYGDDHDEEWYRDHLTIGKKYKINDVDFHFPNKIVVKSDYNKSYFFLKISLFSEEPPIAYMRDKTIDKILNGK